MKSSAILIGVLALALSGCGEKKEIAAGLPAPADPCPSSKCFTINIAIDKVNGKILAPDVIFTNKKHEMIVWEIVEDDRDYKFPTNGIVFKLVGGVVPDGAPSNCKVIPPDFKKFSCDKVRHVKDKKFEYAINVTAGPTSPPLPTLDPWINNR